MSLEYTKVRDIYDFLVKALPKMGYEIDTHLSNLSGSSYIVILNYEDVTGVESTYNDSEFHIRISDHNLPSSYDGLHGYADLDIYTTPRSGNDGGASDYVSATKFLADMAGKAYPQHIQNIDRDIAKQKAYEAELEKERKSHETDLDYIFTNSFNPSAGYDLVLDYLKDNDRKNYEYAMSLFDDADSYTGDKRKKKRKMANEFLKDYAYKYLI